MPTFYLKKGYFGSKSLLISRILSKSLFAFVMTRNSTRLDLSSSSKGLAKDNPFARNTLISHSLCESIFLRLKQYFNTSNARADFLLKKRLFWLKIFADLKDS